MIFRFLVSYLAIKDVKYGNVDQFGKCILLRKVFSLKFFCCIEMKCIYYVVLPIINTTEVEL